MDAAERWTQDWIDRWSGQPVDWTASGDRRPRALDRTEVLIRRPPAFRAVGEGREELVTRRGVAEARLADVDRKLAALIDERRALVARIEACHLAIAGTGVIRASDGTAIQRLRTRQALPFADPMPEPVAGPAGVSGPEAVSGHRLRAAVEQLLLATGQPVTLRELERLLRLQGLAPRGRPSQTLANALRPAIADGTVMRTGRGCYRAA